MGKNVNYINVIPDSQFYTNLDMIKHSLEIMQLYYTPNNNIKDDFSFAHMIKGIENTVERGYDLKKDDGI